VGTISGNYDKLTSSFPPHKVLFVQIHEISPFPTKLTNKDSAWSFAASALTLGEKSNHLLLFVVCCPFCNLFSVAQTMKNETVILLICILSIHCYCVLGHFSFLNRANRWLSGDRLQPKFDDSLVLLRGGAKKESKKQRGKKSKSKKSEMKKAVSDENPKDDQESIPVESCDLPIKTEEITPPVYILSIIYFDSKLKFSIVFVFRRAKKH
jgi:cell division protein FtsW (lipid II flippase)